MERDARGLEDERAMNCPLAMTRAPYRQLMTHRLYSAFMTCRLYLAKVAGFEPAFTVLETAALGQTKLIPRRKIYTALRLGAILALLPFTANAMPCSDRDHIAAYLHQVPGMTLWGWGIDI